MTTLAARVGEAEARDRDELPRVAVVGERELQHAGRAAVAHLAVGEPAAVEDVHAGADDEFSDAELGIGRPVSALRGEALVVLIVRVEHDFRSGAVQIVPQRLHRVVDGR